MGAGVHPEGHARNGSDVAFFLIGGAFDMKLRIARPVDHAVAHVYRNIDPVVPKPALHKDMLTVIDEEAVNIKGGRELRRWLYTS